MKSVIAASTLVLLMAGPACAMHGPPCKTFDRSDSAAPQFVGNYLKGDATVLFVSVCGNDDLNLTFYFGAGNLVRDGNVCRYSEYELTLSPGSPPRLEREAAHPQTSMLVSESEACPSPRAIKYATIYDVSQNVVVHLVRVWRDAISSLVSFDGTIPLELGAYDWRGVNDWHRRSRSRLRDVILQGRSDHLTVLGIFSRRDLFGLWNVYELEVTDPDHFDQFYAVTISSWFGRAYAITAVGAGFY